LQVIPHGADLYSEAVFDTVMLSVLSIPAIYLWVIKPFVNARDVTLAQFSHLALTDPLTELANRRHITKQLDKLITANIRHQDRGAVLLIDLDGFKPVNDRYGHEAGDAVLVEVAKRLQSIVRSEDNVGRLGGDEFIVLLHRLGADERLAHNRALRVAETLIHTISKPLVFNGETLQVGASIGIRLLGIVEQNSEVAIKEADNAMYSAKESGRGCAVFFEN